MHRSWILQRALQCRLLCSKSASLRSRSRSGSTASLLQQKRLLTSSGPLHPEFTSVRYPQVKRKLYAEVCLDQKFYDLDLLDLSRVFGPVVGQAHRLAYTHELTETLDSQDTTAE